ncbi:DoxX family protein [Thalassospira alkalitolerans]|uniref:DoxX family protein n=1 Tax=Thalassospira alkalitolerans TaxID=1293890 RepID=UPI0030EE91A7|tara:strand:- start:19263 stop:19655 length:393 start_codon:yes stop_codon:yes gene_type:complete
MTQTYNHGTFLLARILLVAVFIFSGATKLMDWSGGIGEMEALGLPFPALCLASTIAVQILASLSLIAGVFVRVSVVFLAGFTILATLIAHDFWNFSGIDQLHQATTVLEHASIIAGFLLVVLLHKNLCRD